MPRIRKRIPRKKGIERPEELLTLYERTVEYIRRNKRPFLFASLIISVLIVASATIFFLNIYYNNRASALEYEASRFYNVDKPYPGLQISPEERYKKALELYQEIVSKYPKTTKAAFALYGMGNCYFQLNNFDGAEKSYRQLIEKYQDEKFILSLTYQKLGYIYKIKGDTKNALKNFENITYLDAGLKDLAYIEIGRIYEKEGKTEEAIKNYQKILDNFPSSAWHSEAKGRLENLKK